MKEYSKRQIDKEYLEETFIVKVVSIIEHTGHWTLLCDDGSIIRGVYIGDMAYDDGFCKFKLPLNQLIKIITRLYIDGIGERVVLSIEKENLV